MKQTFLIIKKNVKKNIILLLSFVISAFFILSCTNDKYCTEEYRTIAVNINDSSNNPIILDKYYVIKTSTNDTIVKNDDELITNNNITIFTDSDMKYTNNNGLEFRLTGYLNNIIVVVENYIISHDDCHINLVSGKTIIIVE